MGVCPGIVAHALDDGEEDGDDDDDDGDDGGARSLDLSFF